MGFFDEEHFEDEDQDDFFSNLEEDSLDRRALESFLSENPDEDLSEAELDTWETLLEEAYTALIENPSKENLELAERISAYLEIAGD